MKEANRERRMNEMDAIEGQKFTGAGPTAKAHSSFPSTNNEFETTMNAH